MLSLRKIFAATAALIVVSALAATPVQAVNNDTVSVYFDAPFVQGSYTTSATPAGVQVDFNGLAGPTCPSTVAFGTITGACRVDAVSQYGGASTTGSSATVAGSGSDYATTTSPTLPITITLTNPSKYFGLWWSAGSPSNTIKFYSNNQLVITLTTQSIITQLGSAPSPWPGSNFFTAMNTNTYNKGWYFGNPRGYSSTTPSGASTITSGEPFVYLHLFADGSLTFDKIELSGAGFEFDNLAVSTQAQTPDQRLVLSQTIYGNHAVTFNNNTGSGTMSNQVANTSTALTANTFTKPGYSFTGWNTQADGLGTPYTNQQLYSFDQPLDLFAQWQAVPYTVTYDTQGGSTVAGDTYTVGSTVTLPSPPTRNGFTFSGWFTAASGGSALGSTYNPPGTGNITLYAHWTAVPAAQLALTGSKTLTSLWLGLMMLLAGFAFVSASWSSKLNSRNKN